MNNENNIQGSKGGMDYTSLRNFGLEHIRRIGSAHWTDFNVHDPGVTIFEAVSVAVADLAYRSSSAMRDLLTRRGMTGPALEGAMFPAREIFAQAPTTFEDYRKLILENVPGVRNVSFKTTEREVKRPYIVKKLDAGFTKVKGFYDVLLELEDEDVILQDNLAKQIVGGDAEMDEKSWKNYYKSCYCQAVRRLLLEERNLCEMPRSITVMESLKVGICADLEILSDFDPLQIIQDIHDALYKYVSPTIEFHEIEDLIAGGKHAADFIGARTPLLGFIDRDELSSFSRRTDLYISDVIRILCDVPGVKSVKHVHFNVPIQSREYVKVTDWSLHMNGDYTFSLTPLFLRSGIRDKSLFCNRILFLKNKLSFLPPMGEDGMRAKPVQDVRVPLKEGFSTSLADLRGTYRETDRYFSFQNLLPKTYRMGVDSLPESASTLRKAQRRQLKAYLTFFDQTLSDYLAQIDRFQDLMSLELDNGEGHSQTYFHKRFTDADIVDVSEVLEGYPNYAIPEDDPGEDLRRKNNVMNHLLSMFADSFAEYAALKFVAKNGFFNGQFSQFSMAENVEDKKRFLKDYPIISSRRSSAPDLNQGFFMSGAERRILRKIGVNDPESRQRIAGTDYFGLHIIEHTLLAPYTYEGKFLELTMEDNSILLSKDPYSFHVTAAMPGWTPLASDQSFREYVENIIREELPAHLMVKICWLSKGSMAILEQALDSMSSFLRTQPMQPYERFWAVTYDIYANNLVYAFSKFYNIYPGAVLAADDVVDYTDEDVSRVDFAFLEGPDEVDCGDFNFPGMKIVFEEALPAPAPTPLEPAPAPPKPGKPGKPWKPSKPSKPGKPGGTTTPTSKGKDKGDGFHFPGMGNIFDNNKPAPPTKPVKPQPPTSKVVGSSVLPKGSSTSLKTKLYFPGDKLLLDWAEDFDSFPMSSQYPTSQKGNGSSYAMSSGTTSGKIMKLSISFPGSDLLIDGATIKMDTSSFVSSGKKQGSSSQAGSGADDDDLTFPGEELLIDEKPATSFFVSSGKKQGSSSQTGSGTSDDGPTFPGEELLIDEGVMDNKDNQDNKDSKDSMDNPATSAFISSGKKQESSSQASSGSANGDLSFPGEELLID